MISTQRLVVIAIFLSAMMGFAGILYEGVREYDEKPAYFINISDHLGTETRSEMQGNDMVYGGMLTENQVQDNSVLNVILSGIKAIGIFAYSLLPFSVLPNASWSPIENNIVWVIIIFRSLLTAFIILEMVMFFRNKKNS